MNKKKIVILRVTIVCCLLILSSCTRLSGQTDQQITQNHTDDVTVTESQMTETIETPTNPVKEPIVLTQPQFGREIVVINEFFIDGDENYKNETYLLGNGNATLINGIILSLEYSINQSSVAILFDTDDDGGRLVLYDGTSEILISEIVSLYQLSKEGNAVAYVEDFSETEETGRLLCYFNDSEPRVVISENCGRYFAISSNGKHVAYTERGTSDEINNFHCYLFSSSGQRREIGENVIPIAVSDDGELVYGVRVEIYSSEDYGLSLWVFKDGMETELGDFSGTDSPSRLIFNNDCSQILFESDEGLSFSHDGNTPIRITQEENMSLRLFSTRLPNQSAEINGYWITSYFAGTTELSFVPFSVGIHNYKNSLIYFDEDLKVNVIVNNIGKYFMKEQTIYTYSYDRESIISLDFSEENGWEINDIVLELSRPRFMEMSKDNSIFYIDNAESLFKLQTDGASEPELISNQCVSMVRVSRDGQPDLFYYLQHDSPLNADSDYISIHYNDLYVIEDTPDAVPQLVSEKVGLIAAGDFGVYYVVLESVSESILNNYPGYCTGDVYDLNRIYYANDGEDFLYIGTIKMLYYSPGG